MWTATCGNGTTSEKCRLGCVAEYVWNCEARRVGRNKDSGRVRVGSSGTSVKRGAASEVWYRLSPGVRSTTSGTEATSSCCDGDLYVLQGPRPVCPHNQGWSGRLGCCRNSLSLNCVASVYICSSNNVISLLCEFVCCRMVIV